MIRRTLSLYTALCLLAGTFALPAAPLLVCRITGSPMAGVSAEVQPQEKSCCAVASTLAANGSIRFALTDPGCCDLRQSQDPAELPAVTTVPDVNAVAWTPTPPVIYLPPAAAKVSSAPVADESAPRGPPLCTASPRFS